MWLLVCDDVVNLDVESYFKILDWSSHTAKVYLNGINALFCYETWKPLASSTYQQMNYSSPPTYAIIVSSKNIA